MRMQHTRRGFTLVELLVAAALTMLIMAILASTFQVAMDGMSHLRAAAEMQDRLRSASERLRSDLMAPHFDDEAIARGKLSHLQNSALPAGGYFNIIQITPSVIESKLGVATPTDYSSISTNHALAFTAKLSGKNTQNLFMAPRAAGLDQTNDNLINDPVSTYASKWAIVSWFVTSSEMTTGPNPRTMYTMHRRVKLLAETLGAQVPAALVAEANKYYVLDTRLQFQRLASTTPTIQYGPVEPNPNYGRVLTVKDPAIWGPQPVIVAGIPYINGSPATENPPLARPTDLFTPVGDGSDIVVSNVLSFEVKADYTNTTASNPVSSVIAASPTTPPIPANPQNPTLAAGIGYPTLYPRPAQPLPVPPTAGSTFFNPFANPDFPFDDLPRPYLNAINPLAASNGISFDTGSPPGYRIKGLQVKMRIYDPKTQTSRQVTVIQEM
jgi:type II secretory pathway pseudopilin PulG